jgi:hypothetical protein
MIHSFLIHRLTTYTILKTTDFIEAHQLLTQVDFIISQYSSHQLAGAWRATTTHLSKTELRPSTLFSTIHAACATLTLGLTNLKSVLVVFSFSNFNGTLKDIGGLGMDLVGALCLI